VYVQLATGELAMKINWFGLVGGVLTLALAVASLRVPWWQITVGENLTTIGLSPDRLSVILFGVSLTWPIIVAIDVIFLLLLVAAGIALIIYSVVPARPYSKHLLGFAYKKPLGIFLAFAILVLLLTNVGSIISLIYRAGGAGSINLPWSGVKTIVVSIPQSATISVPISTSLQWTFWLAMVIAILCVATRIYHRRFTRVERTELVPVSLSPSSSPMKPK
jgi:hypothetical protein